ncbi:MAG: undecaprenyl-diphosphate phosphatase [Pirellulaceae bacterium]|nr:undecaprenyl-diphosphate phosphatase [Pirellulaceae bacterium]
MNDYLKAAIIGVVEGLTEFLPVSSTAHIRIAQKLLGVDLDDSYWKMFAIVIQLGAILSVVVYFRSRILEFIKSYPKGKSGDRTWWNHPLALVIISFVVTAVPCFLIDDQIGDKLENLQVIGWALIVGGVVMWLVDRVYSSRATTLDMESMSLKQSLMIGFTQIFAAALPGTSRSMATIAGGQVTGLSRTAALEFSFFLSIPVMFAATSFKMLQFVLENETPISTHQWGVLSVGFAVSFVVALAVIAWFMGWVRKHGFAPFAIYRLIVGAAVLLWLV